MVIFIGLGLIALGLLYCIIGAIFYCKTQDNAKTLYETLKKRIATMNDVEKKNIQDFLDAIGKIVENFAKLTSPVQMSLLGTAHIAIGVYLLINKPF